MVKQKTADSEANTRICHYVRLMDGLRPLRFISLIYGDLSETIVEISRDVACLTPDNFDAKAACACVERLNIAMGTDNAVSALDMAMQKDKSFFQEDVNKLRDLVPERKK